MKLRAERKAGELLTEADIPDGRPNGDSVSPLKRLGIEKHQSSRWQRIASLPEHPFDILLGVRDPSLGPSVTGEQTVYGDLLDFLIPPDWHADGACKEHPDLSWFPTRETGPAVRKALAVCNRCLVKTECLAWALEQGSFIHGIWGGATERERRRMRSEKAA